MRITQFLQRTETQHVKKHRGRQYAAERHTQNTEWHTHRGIRGGKMQRGAYTSQTERCGHANTL